MLPRDTPKYTSSVKPEDWLVDYCTAINIANDNKRVAVKYVPPMLQGTAQTWLNNFKPRNINSWVDFTEAFVRNCRALISHFMASHQTNSLE